VRYVLFICAAAESAEADSGKLESSAAALAESGGWREEMKRRGVLLDGAALWPTCDATTVRVRAGSVQITDGPFAKTPEQIGGISLIECADLDEAIEVAEAHPAAGSGLVEIRPVREW
jgi:hypothetical protein